MSGKSAKYRYRMFLQEFVEVKDAVRQTQRSWHDSVGFWGSIELAYKGEEQIGGTRESDVPMVASLSQVWLMTRWRRSLVFSPRLRVRMPAGSGGTPAERFFQVVAVYEWGRQKEYKVLCLEVQP